MGMRRAPPSERHAHYRRTRGFIPRDRPESIAKADQRERETLEAPAAFGKPVHCHHAGEVDRWQTGPPGAPVEHPRVTFQLLADESAASYRALDERKVDLAILRIFEPVAQAHLSTEVLFDEPYVVTAGARSPWTRRHRVHLADLMNEPWVLPPLDTLTGVRESFRAVGLDVPTTTVVTSSAPARNALVATGRFISIRPPGGPMPARKPDSTCYPSSWQRAVDRSAS